jgi:Uncharacterized protein conserved in bacteria (DUF2188)
MRHYIISKHDKGWQLKQAKADRAQFIAGTKQEAVKKAAAWARANASDVDPISVKIFGVDGSAKEERTYPRSADEKGRGKVLHFAGISSEGATQLASVLTRLKRYDEGR